MPALRFLCGSAGLSIQIPVLGIPCLSLILCIRAAGMCAACETGCNYPKWLLLHSLSHGGKKELLIAENSVLAAGWEDRQAGSKGLC